MAHADQYLSESELKELALASVGRHVFISRRAVLSHPNRVRLGDRVRIDDFTLITGSSTVTIGSNVHLGTSVTINATAPVEIGDFSGLAAGVKLFTSDDDYSGQYLTGPTVPEEHANVTAQGITIERHCVVGANSVILPGANLAEGVAVGALSLVKSPLKAWGIYGGVPVRLIKQRSKELLTKAESITPPNAA